MLKTNIKLPDGTVNVSKCQVDAMSDSKSADAQGGKARTDTDTMHGQVTCDTTDPGKPPSKSTESIPKTAKRPRNVSPHGENSPPLHPCGKKARLDQEPLVPIGCSWVPRSFPRLYGPRITQRFPAASTAGHVGVGHL